MGDFDAIHLADFIRNQLAVAMVGVALITKQADTLFRDGLGYRGERELGRRGFEHCLEDAPKPCELI